MKKTVNTSWKSILDNEFEKDYFKAIEVFINHEKANAKSIYPLEDDIFKAFNITNFEETKVVILGQDPYHGKGQAMGLSFSVPFRQKIPPSLKNIFKELHSDLGFNIPNHGNLTAWAAQGVLLLNAILTVNEKEPASHKKAGWENFTDSIIKTLSNQSENIVFLLWGNFAQKKRELIDENKHLVLTAAHPSPFSAHSGFFSCKHFSKTNNFLQEKGIKKINWEIKENEEQLKLF